MAYPIKGRRMSGAVIGQEAGLHPGQVTIMSLCHKGDTEIVSSHIHM